MDDRSMFVIYFSGLAAMRYHPRNIQIEKTDKTRVPLISHEVEDMAFIAKQMVEITNEFFPED